MKYNLSVKVILLYIALISPVSAAISISGFVWDDTDTDSSKDAGENGIQNVNVFLFDESSLKCVAQATTDASGYYSFSTPPFGDYQVIEAGSAILGLDNTPLDNTAISCIPENMATDPSGYAATTPNIQSITLNNDGSISNRASPSLWPASLTSVDFGNEQATAFGSCSDSFLTQGPTDSNIRLNKIDLNSGQLNTYPSSSTKQYNDINALGFNHQDGFIYGLERDSSSFDFSRIDANGNWSQFTGAGDAISNSQWSADINGDGYWLIGNANSPTLYVVDVNASRPTFLQIVNTLSLNKDLGAGDIAWNWHPVNGDGKFYSVNDKTYEVFLLDFNGPLDQASSVTKTEIATLSGASGNFVTATYFDATGNLYIYLSNSGNFYRINDAKNISSGSIIPDLISTLPDVSFSDGAGCMQNPSTSSDYGDAPDTYGSASHSIPATLELYLGTTQPDSENNSQNTTNGGTDGTGDDSNNTDDEDGISAFPVLYDNATSYTLPVANISLTNTSGNSAILYGFIDFNRDGDFTDAGEVTSATISSIATQPDTDLIWSSPAGLSTGSTYARFRLSSDIALSASGSATDGEVEDYAITIDTAPICTAISGEVNIAISPISTLKTESGGYNNKLFVATTDNTNNTGNVRAYAIGADELPASSESWNAAGAMATQNLRDARLFTSVVSNGSSSLVTFGSNQLTNDSFQSSGIPSYQMIKSNVASAAMGRVSPNSNILLLEDHVSQFRYLGDSAYRSFYKSTISKRSSVTGATVPSQVLVTSDDGFLYSFNQSNGNLNWGWMPPSLALELKYAAGFADQHYMEGEIDQLDLKSGTSGNSTFDSYIVGSYRDGLGQYVLKVASDGSLASVVWDTDHTSSNVLADAAPNHGKRVYFSDINGIKYMAYIITSSGTDSVLHIRSMVDDNTHIQITLGFTATSTPFVMPNLPGSSSPAVNTIYLGSDSGNVYAAALFANDNLTINTSLSSALDSNATPVGAIQASGQPSSAIFYIGASVAVGGKYHLHAQSEDRITLFNYDSLNLIWKQGWTTSTASNLTGRWNTTNGTSSFSTDNAITPLPANSRITDKAYIIANSIVLPVALPPVSANVCEGDAYYYFYKLPNGLKPIKTFFTRSNHTDITAGRIRIGKGDAMRMHLTIGSNKKLVALGLADQDVNNGTGISESFYVVDPVTSGVRSWKEL